MPHVHPTPRHRARPAVLAALTLLLVLAGLVATPTANAGTAAQAAPGDADVVSELEEGAHPLRSTDPSDDLSDLDPLGDMVGDADVVGFGEATHGSREFRTMGHRTFRYLVEEQGFRTFAIEINWSTGLQLNEYVLTGQGDPGQIMTDELEQNYVLFATEELLDLVEWARSYNEQHPDDPVMFMGNDNAYPGPGLFDDVSDYAAEHAPHMERVIARLYEGLRPDGGMDDFLADYLQRPLAERRANVVQTKLALRLSQRLPASDAEAHAWTVQNARVIYQSIKLLSLLEFNDDGSEAENIEFARYRDQAMAANTAWLNEQTGAGVFVYEHDAHIAYESYDPDRYPKMLGAFLRDLLGDRYVAIGTTFNQGSFNAWNTEDENESMTEFTVEPAAEGSNEHTLSQVSYPDYLIDLRELPQAARTWLAEKRPNRFISAYFPEPISDVSLGQSFDILIHLNNTQATEFLHPMDGL